MELALLVARLLLSAVFLLAGVSKFADPQGTIQAIEDFGLPTALAKPLSGLLVLAEIATAISLIPAKLAWYGACGALGLLGMFILGIAVTLARGRDPECHCFGASDASRIGWKTLVRNGILGALAGWLVSRGPSGTGPSLVQHLAVAGENERRFFIFAAFVMCLLFYRALRPKKAVVQESAGSLWGDDADEEAGPVQASVSEDAPQPQTERAAASQPTPAANRKKSLPAPEVQPLTAAMRQLLAAGTGLPVGTPAPQFALPTITGERRSLLALRSPGKTICLVFASPHCDPCRALFPYITRWAREYQRTFNFVVIGRGAAMENTAKRTGLDLSRVLLQRSFELSDVYGVKSTPAAVLVGADGLIQSQIAVGRDDIRQLVLSAASGTQPVT